MSTSAIPAPRFPWRLYAAVAGIALAVAGGSWFFRHKLLAQPGRSTAALPVLGTVEGDLRGTDAAGSAISFSESKGHVTACSYLFTKCPHGCSQVFTVMRELRDTFGQRPDFRLASVAVLPDLDPPSFLKDFAASQGVAPDDPWTFLSGTQRQTVWSFMHTGLGLEMTRETPEGERLSQCDYCEHDLRIVLIDRHQRIRGYYQVMNPNTEARELIKTRLFQDTRLLLDSAE